MNPDNNQQHQEILHHATDLAIRAATNRAYEQAAINADTELLRSHIADGMNLEDRITAERTIAHLQKHGRRFSYSFRTIQKAA